MFQPRAVAFAATRPALSQTPAATVQASTPVEPRRLRLPRQLSRQARPANLSTALGLRALRIAWSTELDRGLAFILAPSFLAVGAIAYYSLATEPDLFPLLVPTLLAASLFAASRAWPAAARVARTGARGT